MATQTESAINGLSTKGDVGAREVITIGRRLADVQQQLPGATGSFTQLLYDIALAAKLIAHEVRRAGLADVLGAIGTTNVQGEAQKKLDVFADDTLIGVTSHSGRVYVIASEEDEKVITTAPHDPDAGTGSFGPSRAISGPYALTFDPLDGSSNTDVNVTMGTIFGIYRRTSAHGGPGSVADILQPGRALVAAGYVVYGPSTMLVYSSGQGVHGFTLEPGLGEFLLSHDMIRIPERPKYYSANEGLQGDWSPSVRRFLDWLHGDPAGSNPHRPLSTRYSGSLAADFHRNLLEGGIYFYPAEPADPEKANGKLRLLYEAAPLAFLAEQAGGYASDGRQPILDIVPTAVHQRVPLFIGHRRLVEQAERFIGEAR